MPQHFSPDSKNFSLYIFVVGIVSPLEDIWALQGVHNSYIVHTAIEWLQGDKPFQNKEKSEATIVSQHIT